MKEYDAYLFDVDGTLLDTRELICRSFEYMGEKMRLDLPGRDRINATIGLPLREQFKAMLGHDTSEEFRTNAREIYLEYMMRAYPDFLGIFPGVAEGLARLAAKGKKMAVVTSRRRPTTEKFLAEMGILGYFSDLVTPEDTERHKPNPEPALLAMRKLAADPARTVFIGDAEFDIGCAHGAGIDVAFVVWGGMEYADWPDQPEFVARNFSDLLPDEWN